MERWVGRDGEGLVRVGNKEWRGIGLKAKKKKKKEKKNGRAKLKAGNET